MYEVILLFPNDVKLNAFVLIARIFDSNVKTNGSVLEVQLNMEQVNIACEKFGAIVKRISKV